jgi:hypothetical protein
LAELKRSYGFEEFYTRTATASKREAIMRDRVEIKLSALLTSAADGSQT